MSNLLQPGSVLAHDAAVNPDDETAFCDGCDGECFDPNGGENSSSCCLCMKKGSGLEDWPLCALCGNRRHIDRIDDEFPF